MFIPERYTLLCAVTLSFWVLFFLWLLFCLSRVAGGFAGYSIFEKSS